MAQEATKGTREETEDWQRGNTPIKSKEDEKKELRI
jgi:hypothetical protein